MPAARSQLETVRRPWPNKMPAKIGRRRKAFRSSRSFENDGIQFVTSVGNCQVAILDSPFHGSVEFEQHHLGRESHFHAIPVLGRRSEQKTNARVSATAPSRDTATLATAGLKAH